MTHDAHTARVEHEYSTVWIKANPELAGKWIVRDLLALIDSGMRVSIDTSRAGFVTITGSRE